MIKDLLAGQMTAGLMLRPGSCGWTLWTGNHPEVDKEKKIKRETSREILVSCSFTLIFGLLAINPISYENKIDC